MSMHVTGYDGPIALPYAVKLGVAEQGKLLNEVAELVDAGRIRSAVTDVAGKIDAVILRRVHAQIENGTARGKIVLAGF